MRWWIFGKRNVSGGKTNGALWILFVTTGILIVKWVFWSVITWSRSLGWFVWEQSSISLGNRKVLSALEITGVCILLLHVGSWSSWLLKIERLFHSFVTNFWVLVVIVLKCTLGVIFHHGVSWILVNGIHYVNIIWAWSRSLVVIFCNCKVSSLSIAHASLVNLVFGNLGMRLVLDWQLPPQLCLTARDLESLLLSHWKLLINEAFIVSIICIIGEWWRILALELSMSLWKPTQFGFGCKRVTWWIFLTRLC